jgi:hypothetical protein
MTILEVQQGHYANLDGVTAVVALATFARNDAEFVAKFPIIAHHHRPCWREREVHDSETAPWGCVWYVVDEDGLLRTHSAQYDSSG